MATFDRETTALALGHLAAAFSYFPNFSKRLFDTLAFFQAIGEPHVRVLLGESAQVFGVPDSWHRIVGFGDDDVRALASTEVVAGASHLGFS